MLCCTVCGTWSPHVGPDRLDICETCLTLNFTAVQDQHDPPDLEAFVDIPGTPPARDTAHHMTPRQVAAMRRLAEAWRRQEDA